MPELKKERAQGWTLHYSDHSTALAVPIRNFARKVIASINISGPDSVRNAEGMVETLLTEVKPTALDIMRQVGGV